MRTRQLGGRIVQLPLKGVPEGLHYSNSENFIYAAEGAPQFSEEEFKAKLLVDFAWFKGHELEHEAAMSVVLEFRSVFARNVDVSRPIKCPPMVINTTTEAPVGKRRPDRFPPEQLNFLDKKLKRLMELRVIRTSTSLWNNPIILREKQGPVGWRMCHDNRELNGVTIPFASAIAYTLNCRCFG